MVSYIIYIKINMQLSYEWATANLTAPHRGPAVFRVYFVDACMWMFTENTEHLCDYHRSRAHMPYERLKTGCGFQQQQKTNHPEGLRDHACPIIICTACYISYSTHTHTKTNRKSRPLTRKRACSTQQTPSKTSCPFLGDVNDNDACIIIVLEIFA